MKRKIKKTVRQDKTLRELIHQPQMWIGVGILFILVALAIKTFPFQAVKNTIVCRTTVKTTDTPTSNPTRKAVIKKGNKDNTIYTIKEGDNFWKISQKTCGNGKYYLGIQRRNGYDNDWKALHAGETVTILCEE